METCIEYTEPGTAFITSNERKWCTAIKKLAASRPDECVILAQPETNNGFIYGKFPSKWLKIKPPREIVMSEERKAALAEKLRENIERARKQREGV